MSEHTETETYKRYENKGCSCWCGKHCGSSCMTDGCDCPDCECSDCLDKDVNSGYN